MTGNYTKTELHERKVLIIQNLCQFSEMLLEYVREYILEMTEDDDKVSFATSRVLLGFKLKTFSDIL